MISFRPLVGVTLTTVICLSILVSLGNWQVHRLGWKEALIQSAQENVKNAPVPFEELDVQAELLNNPEELQYRRVTLRGTFDHNKEMHFFSNFGGGQIGYQILTPMTLSNGSIVVVDRGFVPSELKQPESRAAGQLHGEVELVGLVRLSRSRGRMDAAPDLATGEWFVRDLDEMAVWLKLGALVPVMVDAQASDIPGGWPQGGHTRLTFSNNHLGYVITWYGLALSLIVIYVAYHISKGRLSLNRGE